MGYFSLFYSTDIFPNTWLKRYARLKIKPRLRVTNAPNIETLYTLVDDSVVTILIISCSVCEQKAAFYNHEKEDIGYHTSLPLIFFYQGISYKSGVINVVVKSVGMVG